VSVSPSVASTLPPVPAPRARRRLPLSPGFLMGLALGALLAAVALHAGSGQVLSSAVTVEIALQLLGGLAIALAVLVCPVDRRLPGVVLVALMGALAIYSALSIAWAVEPSATWVEANRTFTYFVTLTAGVALVRLVPHRWPSLLGGLLLASAIVSLYSLGTVVFPSWLAPDETFSRLRAPYGYWNAVGLTAALGIPGCLWWGTRREGHAALRALSAPLLALLVLTALLAYPRGALLAVGIALVVWFVFAPRRLRSAALAIVAGTGAVLVALWVFGQDALSEDRVPLDARDVAGHRLGLLVLVMCVGVLLAFLAATFRVSRDGLSPAARRQAGIALLVFLALVPVGGAAMLAASDRGLTGSISHSWTQLTDPSASGPANDPSRLTAVASVRSKYWDDALKVWKAHELTGVGAGGYTVARARYRTDVLEVGHAHGYVVQTMADLGLIGLGLSLALLLAWILGAARAIGGWRVPPRGVASADPERIGLIALSCVVVTFGVHSLLDWTWFIPGTAVPGILAAGWVVGRGRLRQPVPPVTGGWKASAQTAIRQPVRVVAAALTLIVVITMAWATWQPQRAVTASASALEALAAGHLPQARADAEEARKLNPLSVDPLFDLSAVSEKQGQIPAARASLERAVLLQPANPTTWLTLAEFEIRNGQPQAALKSLGAALFLDPRSRRVQTTFLAARAALGSTPPAAGATPGATTPPPPPATP